MKWKMIAGAIVIATFLTSCGQGFSELNKGIQSDSTVYEEEYQQPLEEEKLTKEQLLEKLKNDTFRDAPDMIENTFPLRDVVQGEQSARANVYYTDEFSIEELSTIVVNRFTPEKESELHNDKKVLVYPKDFITFKKSDQDQDFVLIEVASDEFVRNNYSPSFFNGLFALWILDEVLDVDDWGKKRKRDCQYGNCYGGYSSYNKYRPGSSGSLRGSGSRGGGPSSGK